TQWFSRVRCLHPGVRPALTKFATPDKGEAYAFGRGCSRLGFDAEDDRKGLCQKTPKRVESLLGTKVLQVTCGMVNTVILVTRPSPMNALRVLTLFSSLARTQRRLGDNRPSRQLRCVETAARIPTRASAPAEQNC